MYDLLARMYRTGKTDAAGLDKAVLKGWITQAQADEIVASNGDVGVLTAA